MNISKTLLVIMCSSLFLVSCNHKEELHTENNKKQEKKLNHEEYDAVKSAILDYVDGLYEVDTTRIIRSVDTSLRKVGYWYHPKEKKYRDNLPMTYRQLINLTARWNKDGKSVNKNSPKEIVIYDINSKTASAKLTAEWGIDYFHLGKYNNQWKIMNVIWQSMPTEE